MSVLQVEIVSSEKLLYSGTATMVVAPGTMGELGILPRHTPLLTTVKPGILKISLEDGGEELLYVSGGILEVQPDKVTVLADVAERGEDLDEDRAQLAKRAAEEKLKQLSTSDKVDYAAVQAELACTVAQLELIKKLRKK